MKKITYKTRGTCSSQINIEIEGDIVTKVQFVGGCQGNTQGVARLAEGMKVDDVIAKLEHIDCKARGTSCPDQLSEALKMFKTKSAQ